MRKALSLLAELTKFRITAFSTLTAAAGFLLTGSKTMGTLIAATLGVLSLACGSAVLNQIQERDIDARMSRTKHRPLPTKRISTNAAFDIAFFLLVIGVTFLWVFTNKTATLLGLLAVVWYNGVYTPLKRVTAFAAVPGALLGALPPAIGWVSAGGSLTNPTIILFSFFVFVWQIPHFWLLLLVYGKDYSHNGVPSLVDLFTPIQLRRVTFVWIVATTLTGVLFASVLFIHYPVLLCILIGTAIIMMYVAARMFDIFGRPYSFGQVFQGINAFALIYVLAITAHGFL